MLHKAGQDLIAKALDTAGAGLLPAVYAGLVTNPVGTPTDAAVPLSVLAGYDVTTVNAAGDPNTYAAKCTRHPDGEVHLLLVALDEARSSANLGDLAWVAAEHEHDHHGGPAPAEHPDERTEARDG